jgi:hypothetical protein
VLRTATVAASESQREDAKTGGLGSAGERWFDAGEYFVEPSGQSEYKTDSSSDPCIPGTFAKSSYNESLY